MDASQLRIAGAGLFFLFIFLSGYRLRHSGRPYNAIVLTVHKLIAVAAFVLLVITMTRSNREAALNTIELTASVVTGLSFLCLIVTGGLLSIDREMPAVISKLHQIAPYVTLLFTVLILYFLQGREL